MSAVRWRLLACAPGTGRWHMAVDAALLDGCAAGVSPPTLRFYTWERPTVSLGYAQDPDAVLDRAACRRLGVGWVRRPTGGRAVLHGGDLTYAVAAPAGVLPEGVLACYRLLAAGLVAGLRALGAPAAATARPGRGEGGAACFLAPARWEVTAGGRKLLGSAQARRRGAVLQHGSLPLAAGGGLLAAVVRGPAGARARLAAALGARAVSLEELLGAPPDPAAVAAALAAGLAAVLGAEPVPGALTPWEEERAAALAAAWPGEDSAPAGANEPAGPAAGPRTKGAAT